MDCKFIHGFNFLGKVSNQIYGLQAYALKYRRSTKSIGKDIEISKSKFVAETQLLCFEDTNIPALSKDMLKDYQMDGIQFNFVNILYKSLKL